MVGQEAQAGLVTLWRQVATTCSKGNRYRWCTPAITPIRGAPRYPNTLPIESIPSNESDIPPVSPKCSSHCPKSVCLNLIYAVNVTLAKAAKLVTLTFLVQQDIITCIEQGFFVS